MLGQTQPGDLGDSNCISQLSLQILVAMQVLHVQGQSQLESYVVASRNTHLLPPKPKSSFRHLKRGIQDFHMNYVLVPADKAANNVVVV